MHLTIEELVQAELAMIYPPSFFRNTNVLFVLGARLVRDPTLKSWRTAAIHDNLTQLTGSKELHALTKTPPLSSLRVQAARHIIYCQPELVVVISGGTSSADRPTSASVIQAELGQVSQRVILLENSHRTMDHFADLVTVTSLCPNDLVRTVMVTNAYHVPRVKAMLERSPVKCSPHCISVEVVAAEAVIRSLKPQCPNFAEVYANDPFVQDFIQSEGRGIEALENGTYRPA